MYSLLSPNTPNKKNSNIGTILFNQQVFNLMFTQHISIIMSCVMNGMVILIHVYTAIVNLAAERYTIGDELSQTEGHCCYTVAQSSLTHTHIIIIIYYLCIIE